jgi:hypothetical protein
LGGASTVYGGVTAGNPYSGIASILAGLTSPTAVALNDVGSTLASAITAALGTAINAVVTGYDLAVAYVDVQQCMAGSQ